MLERLDRRVIPEPVIAMLRGVQAQVPCHLAGGAALSGGHLAHRLSHDIDLFVHDGDEHRQTCRLVQELVLEMGGQVAIVQDAVGFWRARVCLGDHSLEVDVVHERVADLEPPSAAVDGVVLESLVDLRARKLTCLLQRSEPRDLVDVLFLERIGYRPEDDLRIATAIDAGMDPGVLAWLLSSFPVEPLPEMLLPLSVDELRQYRDELAERFRRLAAP